MIHSRQVTGSGQVAPAAGEYNGYSFRETGGTNPAVIRVRGGDAAGPILDTISIPAGASQTQHYGTQGVWAQNGIYVEIVSGTVEGCIRTSFS